ncbi:hypothetical protein LBMAG42_57030 [Deltaproteobacteria bacterium]|nr:hypothetical protein LBMAG42_57030 [Deltaproteobacteria bacterium]
MGMPISEPLLREIAVLALIVAAGAVGLRRVSAEALNTLSRSVVDVALPALVFSQLLATTTAADLQRDALVPVLGFALLAVAALVGLLAAPLTPEPVRPTVTFLVAVPNWLYLPLPVAAAAWGAEGSRYVLLVNVGALLFIWGVGPRILRRPGSSWHILLNPGLLATGAAVCAILPRAQIGLVGEVVLGACSAVGATAVPLGLLLTGAQLAQGPLTPQPGLAASVLGRLVLAPALCIVAVQVLDPHSSGPSAPGSIFLRLES